MPYCSNCGTKLSDTAAFCQTCGIKAKAAQPEETVQPQPTYTEPATAFGVLKQAAASPLFLTGVIAYTAATVLSIFTTALTTVMIPMLGAWLYKISHMLGLYEAANVIGTFFEFGFVQGLHTFDLNVESVFAIIMAFAVIAAIPSMLCALGMWATYAQGINKRSAKFKTGGLTIIQVIATISLVLVCILFGFMAIALLLGCFMWAVMPGGFVATLLVFAAFLIIVGVGVLAVIYYAKLIKMIRSMKAVACGKTTEAYASVYVAVWCFILAGSMAPAFNIAFGFLSMLAALCTAVASACLGAVIIRYKSKMSRLDAQQQNYTL